MLLRLLHRPSPPSPGLESGPSSSACALLCKLSAASKNKEAELDPVAGNQGRHPSSTNATPNSWYRGPLELQLEGAESQDPSGEGRVVEEVPGGGTCLSWP